MLRTSRTFITEFQHTDESDVIGLYLDPLVRKYLGGVRQESKMSSVLDDLLHPQESSLSFVAREKRSCQCIGLVTVDSHHDQKNLEISYQTFPKWWGKGIGAEVVREVAGYTFDVREVPNLLAETQAANIPSIKLLKKIGMEFERSIYRFGEKQYIYSLSRDSLSR